MDAVQKQIISLSHKIDELYQVIGQLDTRVSEALSESRLAAARESYEAVEANGGYIRNKAYSSVNSSMEHKDILIDVNSVDKYSHQSSEKDLSPEIQIQRLTAQLTAAYNRIAALEEQLLSRRIHS